MFTPRRFCASSFLLFCLLSIGRAQGEQPGSVPQEVSQTNTTVTAAAATDRVRLTAPSNVVRMQLQVIAESGQILFDVSSKGNVLDWSLQDSSGQRLQGSYLIVVTVKSLSGRLTERVGSVSIGENQVELQRVETAKLAAAQQQTVGPIEENSALTILKADEAQAATVIANNGQEGQIIRDRGALSFRIGDFFSGTDEEQMRLTEDGNLGIGTEKPEAKLDVAGDIRSTGAIRTARIEFPDGTVQTKGQSGKVNSDGTITPNATGTGTQNQIAKWTDNAGTLGNANLTEVNGNVGIGTTNPQALLHLATGLGTPTAPSVFAVSNFGVTNKSTGRLYFQGSDQADIVLDNTANSPNQRILQLTNLLGNKSGFRLVNDAFSAVQQNFLIFDHSNGNVGIGTSTPGARLDVAGNINTSTQYNIGGNRILSVAGIDNAFVGFQAGNINTAGKQNSFFGREAGSSNTSGDGNSFFGLRAGASNDTGGGNSFFGFSAGDGSPNGVRNTAIGYGTNVGSSLTNASAIGSRARVDQSNSLVLGGINGVNSATDNTKVGIGVTAPLATLHVVSFSNTAADNTATFEAPTIGSNQSHIHWGTTGDWYIRSAVGTGKVILQDTGGNVGIGTATPSARLHIVGEQPATVSAAVGTNAAPVLQIIGGKGGNNSMASCGSFSVCLGGAGGNVLFQAGEGGDGQAGGPGGSITLQPGQGGAGSISAGTGNLILAPSGGDIGIGTDSPDQRLTVNGEADKPGGGSWATFSDERLKNIKGRFTPGLKAVMQLQPVRYEYKPENALGLKSSGQHIGFGAQAVQKIIPEAVSKNAQGYLLVNNDPILWTMLNAIKEQQREIQDQHQQLQQKRAHIEKLETRLKTLETMVKKMSMQQRPRR